MNDSHIIVQDASLRFRSYRNPSPNLKETFVDKLTKKNYGGNVEFDALKNINLEIRPGDRLGILGLNGAGKSTLLKMIVGIYPPQKGQVSVRGRITPMIELGTGFDAELSGRENIYLNGTLIGRSYKQMKQLEDKIIEFSELGDKIDMPIKYYSSGMHARLAFSIGAIADPEILIMDEIFAAGDAQFVQKSLNRLHQMFDTAHILILVSHSEKHILNICNRAIVLNKGELVMQGSTADCVDHYMMDIVKDEGWTGAAQWIVDPLSFKDRKIIEQLSAGRAIDYTPGAASDTDTNTTAPGEPQADASLDSTYPLSSFEPPTSSEAEVSERIDSAPAISNNSRADIIAEDSGFSLGTGWHSREKFEGSLFRWVESSAELKLPLWQSDDTPNELIVEVETGPSLGRQRWSLKLLDADNKIIDEVVTYGRKVVKLSPPDSLAGTTVKLHADSELIAIPDDYRFLSFRVFDIAMTARHQELVPVAVAAGEFEKAH